MKKLFWTSAFFLFLFVFFLGKQNTTWADDYNRCIQDMPGCTYDGAPCIMSGYDCSQYLEVNDRYECIGKGGCYESLSCSNSGKDYRYCFAPNGKSWDASGKTVVTGSSIVANQAKFCTGPGGAQTSDPTDYLYTAIGCIPVSNTNEFVAFILRWAIGVGGGIAFLLIIIAGFQIMTSSENPDRLQAGKELLGAAIGGLILLIFSVFILKVIGVDILQIPGFGT